MKIGLLLGSFNPITIAHVTMASCVLNSGLCDKVLFVVAKHNPWKKEEPAPFDVRCQMVEAAIKPLGDKCEVCRFEEKHDFPVYSYIPINEAIEAYPKDEICLICGTDTIEKMPKWKKFDTEIKDKVAIIEIKRDDGTEFENPKTPFLVREGSRESLTNRGYWSIKPRTMDVSSTLVREMVHNGMNPCPYVTEEVNRIITENNLYK